MTDKVYFASRLMLGEGETLGPGKDHYTAIYKRTRAIPFDRFGANAPCLNYTLHPFAAYRPKFSEIKFAEACEKRAHEIIDMGKPIRLYWSGGIDSTTALVALIQAGVKPDQMEIACSCESIEERPLFFRRHIVGKYRIVEAPSVAQSLVETDSVIVTGELGDQIFGADTMAMATSVFGNGILKQRACINLWIDIWAVTHFMHQDDGASWLLEIVQSAESAGVRLYDMFDLFWWGNFAFKWQDVCVRSLALSSQEYAEDLTEDRVLSGLCHFFQAPDFQDWAISRKEPKIDVEWRSYKRAAKDFIYALEKDETHRDYGTKVGSMKNLWTRHREPETHAVLKAEPWGFSTKRPKLYKSRRAAWDKYETETFSALDGSRFQISAF